MGRSNSCWVDLLSICDIFGAVVQTFVGIKPIGYKWVFVRKHTKKNEFFRYKAQLIAQDFLKRAGIDCAKTHSLVISVVTFQFLINLVVFERLDIWIL